MAARRKNDRIAEAFALARELALALPGIVLSTSYRTPAFKVGSAAGGLLARLHQDDDALVVRVDPLHRDTLIASAPDVFFVTDHYVGWPWVLVRLSTVSREQLARVLKEAWHELAKKRPSKARPKRRRPAAGKRG